MEMIAKYADAPLKMQDPVTQELVEIVEERAEERFEDSGI